MDIDLGSELHNPGLSVRWTDGSGLRAEVDVECLVPRTSHGYMLCVSSPKAPGHSRTVAVDAPTPGAALEVALRAIERVAAPYPLDKVSSGALDL
jgi:hypothetical protein